MRVLPYSLKPVKHIESREPNAFEEQTSKVAFGLQNPDA